MSGEFLAVDAGNSKTVAVVCTAAGQITGRGRAQTGDIYAAPGATAAVGQVVAAVDRALAGAGVEPHRIRHAAFRLAGADWPADHRFWDAAVRERFPGLRSWTVRNDGFSMIRLAALSGAGVSVIAGTGPAIAARGPRGVEFSASWWIQDSLGGVGLGDAAFRAVVRAEIGLEPATDLTERLLDVFDCPDVTALLELFTRRVDARPGTDKRLAARSVLAAADDGDPAAVRIIEEHGRLFAEYTVAAARRAGFDTRHDRVPVGLGGSLMSSEHAVLRRTTTDHLDRQLPGTAVTATTAAPVVGAILDALAEGGVAVTNELRTNLTDVIHPDAFLRT